MYYTIKSGILDFLFITIHNERTKLLADLVNLYLLAKTLLLSLITQTHISGEKPCCGHPKQEKEMRLSITLTAYEKQGTCTHLEQSTYLQFPLYLALKTACSCSERALEEYFNCSERHQVEYISSSGVNNPFVEASRTSLLAL